jgi:hypothetical protein
MEELDDQISKEIEDGVIPDPAAIDPITGEPLPPEGEEMVAADAITAGQLANDNKVAEI